MDNFTIITVVVDIHPDGDVYVHGKDNVCRIIGSLGERDYAEVPNECYKKAKRKGKLIKDLKQT